MTGWSDVDGKLTKAFSFEAFLAGIAFVQKVGDLAEELDHHPDIDIRWRTVTIAVNTHDAGNTITAKDHELARRIDLL
jgi:4a-hydroxytetrahydrobiopterin dehydratase